MESYKDKDNDKLWIKIKCIISISLQKTEVVYNYTKQLMKST
jgi:hypothetical protein